ncbi:MAG: helix-turn-helix transcriptional regulator [Eubacteriales bacterium]|jgi:DNA-binding XRE family transcriptional regulator
MERGQLIQIMADNLKLIRSEYNMTQDQMSKALGISKKTLVEIEKGRISPGWTTSCAAACIFAQSNVLRSILCCPPEELASALALQDLTVHYPKTMGGKIWWRLIRQESGYRIQQNYFTQHFRLLNCNDEKICSSFHYGEVEECLRQQLLAEAGGLSGNQK